MQTILITGGTGLVGKRLTQMLLEKGFAVNVLSRNVNRQSAIGNHESVIVNQPTANGQSSYAKATEGRPPTVNYFQWNIDKQIIDAEAISSADYIIHLAGAGVADKRWSKKRKAAIVSSRTQSSALIIKALKEISNNVKGIISASAIGWYGADKNILSTKSFTETDTHDDAFLGTTCYQWENSIEPVAALNKRLVKLRIGIVLSNDGGALAEFKKPLKAGVAAILGNGNQTISWIHINDLCRMFLYAIENENMNGVFNAVAPKPVSNKTLTLILAKATRKSFYIPVYVPSFVLKIMLGEMNIEVLKSTTVSCDKIKNEGFTFLYPSVEAAINELNTK